MKTFVYLKKGSKVIATLNNVVTVVDTPRSSEISFITDDGRTYTYNKKIYKTTTYQN